MSQVEQDITQDIERLKQIEKLKQSLSNHSTTQSFEFETPENLISVLKVKEGQIKFYWDINRPWVILSSPSGDKLIDLHDLEGLPKECSSNRKNLSAYLQQTRVHVSSYDNNEGYRLHFNLKLLGGANIIDPVKASERLWPNAIIPIFVDCSTFNKNELETILSAVNDWAKNTLFSFKVHFRGINEGDTGIIYKYAQTDNLQVSCSINKICPLHKLNHILLSDHKNKRTVLLAEEPQYADRILIQKYTPACRVNPRRDEMPSCNVCQSFVGRQGGEQLISCKLGDSFGESDLKHELGHAIGFYHEQQRPDRDQYVVAPNLGAADANYGKEFDGWFRRTFGEYDFKSIMHYFFGRGMIGSQSVSMNVQEAVPMTQYRQLVELGAPGYTPSFDYADLTSSANRDRVHAGLHRVGRSGSLSQTDIDAANYLAREAKARSSSRHNASATMMQSARRPTLSRWN